MNNPQPRGPLRDELGAAKYRHEAIAAVLRATPGRDLQVMAHRREREPFAGQWALPSGPKGSRPRRAAMTRTSRPGAARKTGRAHVSKPVTLRDPVPPP